MANIELSKTEISVLIDSLSSNYYANKTNPYDQVTAGFQDKLLAKLVKERNK